MSDFVLIDGDQAVFSPGFGAATVVVQPGALRASGPTTVGGKKVCVAGDEKSVSVPGCAYMTPSHSIPGTGTLEIQALAGDQTATKTSSGSTRVMLVGGSFTAAFAVQSPAKQPSPSGAVPDPMPRYTGSGSFVTTNAKLKGT
jgi:contractile injection system spike tip protein